tara:strand:+ start:383 stop:1114 length:732 start_codon:yes stop_codon:yes gene_type:complete
LVRVEEGSRAIFVSEIKQPKTLIMKTLHENQNWSLSLKAAPTITKESQRSQIGDDDGISNKAMNALIVLLTLITLITSIGTAVANDDVKYRILLRQAMLDIDRAHYEKALVKLLEVRANTEGSANVNHLIGTCYLHVPNSDEKAAFYLSQAVNSTSADYQEWDLDEQNAPLNVAYHLATVYERLEEFDKAADYYGQFLATMESPDKPNTSRTYAIISQNADKCKVAYAQRAVDLSNENVVVNQ